MTIVIRDTTGVGNQLSLSELSNDIKSHLESVFSELIKSPNFQDLHCVENEEYFYAMLFMQKSKQILEDNFHVPFRVSDYFISDTKGEELGKYAPFYYSGSNDEMHYMFTLAYGCLAFLIKVEHKFLNKDFYLRPSEQCIEYVYDYIFKAKVKYTTLMRTEVKSHNDSPNVTLNIFNQKISLDKLFEQLDRSTKNQFELFKKEEPEWLIACFQGRGFLNVIIKQRWNFISSVINNVFSKSDRLKENVITIKKTKLSQSNINQDKISLPFVVTLAGYIQIRCCLNLSYPNTTNQINDLYRKELINFWKKIAENIEVNIIIEGIGYFVL